MKRCFPLSNDFYSKSVYQNLQVDKSFVIGHFALLNSGGSVGIQLVISKIT